MKKTTIIICICTTVLQLASCAKKTIPTKSETPAEEVAGLKNKYSEAQMAQGKTIFLNNCGKCHDLHMPEEYTVHGWNNILPGMMRKATLDKQDAGLVRAWVITNAKAG